MTSPCFGNLCWLLPVTASPLFGNVPSQLQSPEEHFQPLYMYALKIRHVVIVTLRLPQWRPDESLLLL